MTTDTYRTPTGEPLSRAAARMTWKKQTDEERQLFDTLAAKILRQYPIRSAGVRELAGMLCLRWVSPHERAMAFRAVSTDEHVAAVADHRFGFDAGALDSAIHMTELSREMARGKSVEFWRTFSRDGFVGAVATHSTLRKYSFVTTCGRTSFRSSFGDRWASVLRSDFRLLKQNVQHRAAQMCRVQAGTLLIRLDCRGRVCLMTSLRPMAIIRADGMMAIVPELPADMIRAARTVLSPTASHADYQDAFDELTR